MEEGLVSAGFPFKIEGMDIPGPWRAVLRRIGTLSEATQGHVPSSRPSEACLGSTSQQFAKTLRRVASAPACQPQGRRQFPPEVAGGGDDGVGPCGFKTAFRGAGVEGCGHENQRRRRLQQSRSVGATNYSSSSLHKTTRERRRIEKPEQSTDFTFLQDSSSSGTIGCGQNVIDDEVPTDIFDAPLGAARSWLASLPSNLRMQEDVEEMRFELDQARSSEKRARRDAEVLRGQLAIAVALATARISDDSPNQRHRCRREEVNSESRGESRGTSAERAQASARACPHQSSVDATVDLESKDRAGHAHDDGDSISSSCGRLSRVPSDVVTGARADTSKPGQVRNRGAAHEMMPKLGQAMRMRKNRSNSVRFARSPQSAATASQSHVVSARSVGNCTSELPLDAAPSVPVPGAVTQAHVEINGSSTSVDVPVGATSPQRMFTQSVPSRIKRAPVQCLGEHAAVGPTDVTAVVHCASPQYLLTAGMPASGCGSPSPVRNATNNEAAGSFLRLSAPPLPQGGHLQVQPVNQPRSVSREGPVLALGHGSTGSPATFSPRPPQCTSIASPVPVAGKVEFSPPPRHSSPPLPGCAFTQMVRHSSPVVVAKGFSHVTGVQAFANCASSLPPPDSTANVCGPCINSFDASAAGFVSAPTGLYRVTSPRTFPAPPQRFVPLADSVPQATHAVLNLQEGLGLSQAAGSSAAQRCLHVVHDKPCRVSTSKATPRMYSDPAPAGAGVSTTVYTPATGSFTPQVATRSVSPHPAFKQHQNAMVAEIEARTSNPPTRCDSHNLSRQELALSPLRTRSFVEGDLVSGVVPAVAFRGRYAVHRSADLPGPQTCFSADPSAEATWKKAAGVGPQQPRRSVASKEPALGRFPTLGVRGENQDLSFSAPVQRLQSRIGALRSTDVRSL